MEGEEYSESICGCCTCCCVYLGGVLRFGVSLPIVTSDKISDFDSTLCNGCGVCVDRCQFDAREIVDGKLGISYGTLFRVQQLHNNMSKSSKHNDTKI
jgi:translation initiation factor RLI1